MFDLLNHAFGWIQSVVGFSPVIFLLLAPQIRDLVPESQAYMDLLAFERKLDQTIARKRMEIQEAIKKPIMVSPQI